jgi:hypothetical protein
VKKNQIKLYNVQPKTIKIFLSDGEPTGIKTLEISGWVGKGYIIPRNSLKRATEKYQKELQQPCVYFLVGTNENNEELVYVGESESFTERIAYHQRDKDFWNTAICFIAAHDFLHKGSIKYLESCLAQDIIDAGRVKLEAGKSSNKAKLSESDEADALNYAEHIKLILGTAGFLFFSKPAEKTSHEELFYCRGKGVEATGYPTDEGFVVLKGSKLSEKEGGAITGKGLSITRWRLINSDRVEKNPEGNYTFKENFLFTSPSYAAGVVLGGSINGWTAWKNKDGKTLDEIKRQIFKKEKTP